MPPTGVQEGDTYYSYYYIPLSTMIPQRTVVLYRFPPSPGQMSSVGTPRLNTRCLISKTTPQKRVQFVLLLHLLQQSVNTSNDGTGRAVWQTTSQESVTFVLLLHLTQQTVNISDDGTGRTVWQRRSLKLYLLIIFRFNHIRQLA